MKKILAILMVMLLIGCSSTSRRDEQPFEKLQVVSRELYSEEDEKILKSGGSVSMIIVHNPSNGIFGDAIKALSGTTKKNEKKVQEYAAIVMIYPTKIYGAYTNNSLSHNNNILFDVIKELTKTEIGRKALKQGRFVFVDDSLTGVGSVDRKKLEELSKKYGFRYVYPE